jgi:uncharacterized protein (UPF0276 family)
VPSPYDTIVCEMVVSTYPAVALAVSAGPVTRRLLRTRRLDVDYLELGGPNLDAVLADVPQCRYLVHNALYDWSLAHPRALDQHDAIARTQSVLARTGAPWLSVHLGFSAAHVKHGEEFMLATSPTLPREEVVQTIPATIRALAAALPVPLLLENLNYCPGGAYEYVCAPDFIAQILEDTDALLLLDIAHAQVSAEQLGLSFEQYLGCLPLERVRQVHVSGTRPRNGMIFDAHEELLEDQYALLVTVLRRTSPAVLTLEYQGDEAPLLRQLERLRAVLAARTRADKT